MLAEMERILIVLAHPDDEVLGCGGAIRRFVDEGKQIRVVILGEGSSCRFMKDEIDSQIVQDTIKQRRQFADAALEKLGVTDAEFWDLPCGRFDTVPVIDIGKKIELEIHRFSPDTLITHNGNDANSDHRTTFNAVIAATRPIPGSCVKNVLTVEIPSSTEWRFVDAFTPNYFVNIQKQLDAKIAAFDCYFETEGRDFPFPRCEVGLRTVAAYRGMQVGLPAAEAFMIVRSIVS